MKNWKKIGALLTALVCTAGTAAACGGNDDGPEEGATVVTVWLRDFEDWSNEVMTSIMDDFNKDKTDMLHISYRFISEDGFGDALAAAQDNGTAPDIYQVSYTNLYSEVRGNTILALDDLLPASSFEDLKDTAKELVVYDGHYYAYPQLTEPGAVMYYRKDLLEQAGVDYSDIEEWSFEDLYAACEKLKTVMPQNQGKYPMLGFDFDEAGWATQGLQANLTGGDVCLSEDWTEIIVDSDAYKQLAEFYAELYGNGYVPVTWSTGYNDQIIDLCDGRVAIAYTGSWAIAEIMESYGADMAENIGAATIPTLNGGADKGTTATNGRLGTGDRCEIEESRGGREDHRISRRGGRYFGTGTLFRGGALFQNHSPQEHSGKSGREGYLFRLSLGVAGYCRENCRQCHSRIHLYIRHQYAGDRTDAEYRHRRPGRHGLGSELECADRRRNFGDPEDYRKQRPGGQ